MKIEKLAAAPSVINFSFLIGEKRCMKLIKNFRPLVEGRRSGIGAFA